MFLHRVKQTVCYPSLLAWQFTGSYTGQREVSGTATTNITVLNLSPSTLSYHSTTAEEQPEEACHDTYQRWLSPAAVSSTATGVGAAWASERTPVQRQAGEVLSGHVNVQLPPYSLTTITSTCQAM
jgi:hypothetical protein